MSGHTASVQPLRRVRRVAPCARCPRCKRVLIFQPAQLARLVELLNVINPRRVQDAGDLLYLAQDVPDVVDRARSAQLRALGLLQQHLAHAEEVRKRGCLVCFWEDCAGQARQSGLSNPERAEVDCYNYASRARTFYASKTYRVAAGQLDGVEP